MQKNGKRSSSALSRCLHREASSAKRILALGGWGDVLQEALDADHPELSRGTGTFSAIRRDKREMGAIDEVFTNT